MKTVTALSALVAFATAQQTTLDLSQSFDLDPTPAPTQTSIPDIDVEPSTVQSVSGPIQTDQACGDIAQLVGSTNVELPVVEADLAYACLKSLPFYSRDASATIDEIKKMVEFQSTLTYLKDPPEGWPNDPVDIMAGLDDIKRSVNNGDYDNEYDFENDIAALLIKAHDGHLAWTGMAYAGIFRWRRSSNIALISASDDNDVPQVWALKDFNGTVGYDPSPVTQIDGQDVTEFLTQEAELSAYHDPDTRYNAMFFMQPAESFGYFVTPRFWPGSTTNITYANGTTDTYNNGAIVLQPSTWSDITDADSLYQTYMVPTTSGPSKVKRRDPKDIPFHLENPRDHEFKNAFALQHMHGAVPLLYPEPVVAHSGELVPLAGYFINTSEGEIGILVVQTFNTDDVSGAQEFQAVIQAYISAAQARGVQRHIIDVRTNGGGKVLSGYDMYLQFFPSQEPQTQSRYRGHRASELYGSSISSYDEINIINADLYTSPFSNAAWLSADLEPFADWDAMYPPRRFHNDTFTSLLRYNLSDPLQTSSPRTGVGITLTGYNARSNFTSDPFRPEDLLILTDGICASTCSIFLELMVQQSGVRTLSLGGRPQPGPMVTIGGTKGTLVLPELYMSALSALVISDFASSRSEASEWLDFLPLPAPIQPLDATVNFQDNIRKGLEGAGVPTQFLNDSSSCRIWYEARDYTNVTRLWERVAGVAWGDDGAFVRDACVAGSMASEENQRGQGEGNPQGDGDAGDGGEDEEDAAGVVRPAWFVVGIAGVVAVLLV